MEKLRPGPEVTQIELLAVKCRRDSILRLSSRHATQPGCSSFLVYCFMSGEFEPEWVFLPGLYLLDESLEYLRRVNIRCDDDSFVIVAQAPLPIEPDLVLHRFALLILQDDGDLVECRLWSEPGDPSPIILGREQARLLVNCTKPF